MSTFTSGIITLTTDWGLRDHSAGAMKGRLLSLSPKCQIIDISHLISPYNIYQASFILRNSFSEFPAGSIHIVGVQSEASPEQPHVVVKYKDWFFIGADNGIFSLMFEVEPDWIAEIEIPQDSDYFTFPARDVFARVASMLIEGADIKDFGKKRDSLKESIPYRPTISNNLIKGVVVYVDNFSNVITNISEKIFRETGKGRRFSINFRSYSVDRIHKAYSDVPNGEILALFGTTGLLEIAFSGGNARELLGIGMMDSVRIEFQDQ